MGNKQDRQYHQKYQKIQDDQKEVKFLYDIITNENSTRDKLEFYLKTIKFQPKTYASSHIHHLKYIK